MKAFYGAIAALFLAAPEIPNGSITTPKLADHAVTTAKMATLSVDNTILATGAALANIANGSIPDVKLQSTFVHASGDAAPTFTSALGVASGGTGQTSLSALTLSLSLFSPTQQGVVSGSGGGTTNYLRADGTWSTPPGAGNVSGPVSSTDQDLAIFSGATGKIITDGGVSIANIPTTSEALALAGTSGSPGSGNKYVTDGDARNTNARTPTAHASTHQNGGSDEVSTATAGANAIPKAGAGGTLAIGWLPLGSSSSTVVVGNDSRLSDSRAPNGSAGGDLSGSYPSPTVAKINGVALGSTTATSGDLLVANGTQWVTQLMSGDCTFNSSAAITCTKTSGVAFAASATTDTTNAANISSGTLPAGRLPLFTSVANGAVPASGGGTTNYLRADGTFAAPPGTSSGITALTGDVTASGSGSVAATVAKINGATLGTTTATSAHLLIADGSAWQSVAESGDCTVSNAGAQTCTKTSGATFATSATTDTTSATNVTTGTLTLANNENANSHKIVNVTDPSSAQDAATKNYVDTVSSSLQPIEAVYAASTASITGTYLSNVFTVTATGALSLDGTSPPANARVLLKDQTDSPSGAHNGVYTVTVAGSVGVSPVLTRATDYTTAAQMNAGDLVPVINGTVNAVTSWLQTATITTVGTDALVFVEWSYNPASFLLKANNLSDLASASTARTNLGLTSSATTANASINTVSTLVARDGSGNFSAGTITAALTGTASGNLTSASTLNGANLSAGTVANGAIANGAVANLSGTNSGDVSLGTFGTSPNAKGATISSQVVTMQPFDATHPGEVPTGGSSSTFLRGDATWVTPTDTGMTALTGDATASGSGSVAITVTKTNGVAFANSATIAAASANTASDIVLRDANGSVALNEAIWAIASTTAASGTTTLTVASTPIQKLTGTLSQTFVLPDATTLVVGQWFAFKCRSTGSLFVQTNGGAALETVIAGADSYVYVTDITTAAGVWDVSTPMSSSNVASTLVFRNSSGNVAATTFVGALTGTASGNTTYSANNHGVVVSGSANAMTVIAPVSPTTSVLQSGGASADPTWATIAAIFVNAFESVATTLGDLVYGGSSGTPTRLAGDTSNTRKFLREVSSGGVAAAPAWDTIAAGDIPAAISTIVLSPFAGGLTALQNDTQTSALALTANINRVTTSTSTNNSVTLPTAASGSSTFAESVEIEVINVANAVHVFPASGQTINGQSANVEWSVGIPAAGAAGLINDLECVTSTATNWDCVLSVAAPGHQSGSLGSAAANAGEVGEVIRNTLPPSAVALTSATACNVGATTCPATGGTQSITLTPGDWSCQAMIGFFAGGATSITILAASISKTTHALSGTSTLFNPTSAEARIEWDPAGSPVISASAPLGLVIPPYQVLVAAGATQQLFLVAQATFTSAGLSDFGSIECRRMR